MLIPRSGKDFLDRPLNVLLLDQAPLIVTKSLWMLVFKMICLFLAAGSPLLHVGFLQLRQAGVTLHGGAPAPPCSGAQALGAWTSVLAAHGLSGCGSWALVLSLSSFGTQA